MEHSKLMFETQSKFFFIEEADFKIDMENLYDKIFSVKKLKLHTILKRLVLLIIKHFLTIMINF
jgi:hypothetical protein